MSSKWFPYFSFHNKAEFLITCTKQQLAKVNIDHILQ